MKGDRKSRSWQEAVLFTGSVVFAVTLSVVHNAWADVPNPQGVLGSIAQQFKSVATNWEPILVNDAKHLFWILAGIEFAWTGIKLVLEGADFKQFAGELVRRILFIGFFYAVLVNSSSWVNDIIESFRDAGNAASVAAGGVSGISPDVVFKAGLNVAGQLSQKVSWWHAESSLAVLIAAIIIMIVFALLAAMLLLALIEMYIAINGGVILLGFGGCSWTSDFAKKYLLYCVSVGMKLMVIQLLIGLGEGMMKNWCTSIQSTNEQILAIIGASIAMLALVKSIPDIIQGLVTGVTVNAHTGLLTAAGVAAGAAAGATMATAGSGMAVKEAALSGWQQSGAGGGPGGARIGGAGTGGVGAGGTGAAGGDGTPKLAGGFFKRVPNAMYLTGKSLGKAAVSDVSRKITGENRGFGSMGGRMAAGMREERLGAAKKGGEPGGTSGDGGPGNGVPPRSGGSGNISRGEKN